MSAGETAGRPGTGSVSERLSGQQGESAASAEHSQSDVRAFIRRLAGKPAEDVLARISNGDPLRVYPLCVQRLRDTYFILDPDRVFERALSLMAVGFEVEKECETDDWLVRKVDRAIERVLDGDREDERTGNPPENPEAHFRLFVEGFFREPLLARLASVRLNDLGEIARKSFHHLLIEGRSVDECLEMGLGPPERLQRDILTALQAIGLIDEEGFKELLSVDPEEPRP